MCKMIISPGLFLIFSKFWFFGLLGGKRAKNGPKWEKFCLSHLVSQEPYSIWLSFMVHLYKKIVSPGIFYIFFKILIFQVARGVKGQIMVQNGKKICMFHLLPQELHIMWLSFMVRLCKMIILPGCCFFIIFSIFLFFGLLGG